MVCFLCLVSRVLQQFIIFFGCLCMVICFCFRRIVELQMDWIVEWLWEMISRVVLVLWKLWMCLKFLCWKQVLLIDRVLLMIRMFGCWVVVMLNVRCICMLLEQVCIGCLMVLLILVKVLIFGISVWIFLICMFSNCLVMKMFCWLVKFGWKFMFSLSSVVIWLVMWILLQVGWVVLVIIFSRVFLLVLLILMMLIVLFGLMVNLILCRIQCRWWCGGLKGISYLNNWFQ